MRYVHIIGFDPVTGTHEERVTCVLREGASVVECTGDTKLIAELRMGVMNQAVMRNVTPEDGMLFLSALQWAYKQPTLFATKVLEGDSVKPYRLPEARKFE